MEGSSNPPQQEWPLEPRFTGILERTRNSAASSKPSPTVERAPPDWNGRWKGHLKDERGFWVKNEEDKSGEEVGQVAHHLGRQNEGGAV